MTGYAAINTKRERAMCRRGPIHIQDRVSAVGLEAAPDIVALEPNQQFCGQFDGYGPLMQQGMTLTIRRPTGSQWILVPREIAAQGRGLIGAAVTVRRSRTGK